MEAWSNLMRQIMATGVDRPDRTGAGTRALFGRSLTLDVSKTFPAVTTKRLAFKTCMGELAAFLKGADNLVDFHAEGCHIWDANALAPYWTPRKPGDVGRIYGAQWRQWTQVDLNSGLLGLPLDQLSGLVSGLVRDPYGRRHLVTAWNPAELQFMCLPPCHVMFQACVLGESPKYLDLIVTMRSVDVFLGLPFDIASYAALQALLCKEVGYRPGSLHFHFGDAHIYRNHFQAVDLVLQRKPYPAPTLHLAPDAGLFNFKAEMATLLNYQPHLAVPVPMNV